MAAKRWQKEGRPAPALSPRTACSGMWLPSVNKRVSCVIEDINQRTVSAQQGPTNSENTDDSVFNAAYAAFFLVFYSAMLHNVYFKGTVRYSRPMTDLH